MRNIASEALFVGVAMAILFWVIDLLPLSIVPVLKVFVAGVVGHLLFEYLGWNTAFCEMINSEGIPSRV